MERPLHLGAVLAGAPPTADHEAAAVRRQVGRLPAARRPAGRVRRPVAHRQAGRRRPARGQADAAGRARPAREAEGGARPRRARLGTRRSADARPGRAGAGRPVRRCCRIGAPWTRWSARSTSCTTAALAAAGPRPAGPAAPELARLARRRDPPRPLTCRPSSGPDRPRRRGRRRAGRALHGAAPARRGPAGHARRAATGAGRPGRAARRRRLPPGHRPDRADHARAAGRGLRRGRRLAGATGSTWCRCIPPTGRGSPTAAPSTCTPTPTRWRPRSGRFAGAREAAGLPASCGSWLTELYAAEGRFIGANFDSPLDLARPELARLAALGAFGRLGAKVGGFVKDSGCAGSSPSRPCTRVCRRPGRSAAYAVIAYMDTVGRRVLPARRHAGRAGGDGRRGGRAGAEFRYGTRLPGWSGSARGWRRCGPARRADRLRRSGSDAGPAGGLPADRAPPRRVVPLSCSPSAVVLHGGTDRRGTPGAPHDLASAAAGSGRSQEIIRDRPADERSVAAGHPAHGHRPGAGPGGPAVLSVLAPTPNLDWARSTGTGSARPTATSCCRRWRPRG